VQQPSPWQEIVHDMAVQLNRGINQLAAQAGNLLLEALKVAIDDLGIHGPAKQIARASLAAGRLLVVTG
jgi:hypothetical protein